MSPINSLSFVRRFLVRLMAASILVSGLIATAYSQQINKKTNKSNAEAKGNTQQADSLLITEIQIEGNKITRERIIRRELAYIEGDKIPAQSIDSLLKLERNKIFNTDLFVTADVGYAPTGQDSVALTIQLRERWYIWPIPLMELSDRNFNEWWNNRGRDLSRLNYGMTFKQRNFRGRKEILDLKLQLGFTRSIGLAYSVPFINTRQTTSFSMSASYNENVQAPFRTVGHVFEEFSSSSEQNDVVRRRFRMGASIGKRQQFYDFHRFELMYNYEQIDDSIALLNPDYFLDGRSRQRFFSFYYNYTRNLCDVTVYPLRGSYLNVRVSKLGLGIFDDVNIGTIDGQYARYWPLGGNFFYSSDMNFRLSLPGEMPYVQSRAVGYGTNTLRGYDNYVIEGQHFGILKNTLRWKLMDRVLDFGKLFSARQFNVVPISIFLKSYSDAGYVHYNFVKPGNERMTNNLLLTTGVGLDFVTFYNSVFRLEYSYNRHDNRFGLFFNFTSDF